MNSVTGKSHPNIHYDNDFWYWKSHKHCEPQDSNRAMPKFLDWPIHGNI